ANEELKVIREEKNKAYTQTGDTWHDNPYFNEMEQKEGVKTRAIAELVDVRTKSKLIEVKERNIEQVSIGSIVHFQRYAFDDPDKLIKEDVVEISGWGESDIEKKLLSYDCPLGDALYGLGVGDHDVEEKALKGYYVIVELYSDWADVVPLKKKA
ncbi:MAG: GreA/GreB family elongation factor, partial [Bacteriovoracaceae bacterium]|nr:GreA/GreB family elongation factor [Bacteriovoracaceae bacterium]